MTDQELFEKTRSIIYKNMIKTRKESSTHFHYTKPSPQRYPFQFFWDTCFHAFILTALGEHDMAKEHLVNLFSLQKEDGFVGHMIYWDKLTPGRFFDVFQSKPGLKIYFRSHMSALIQPPLAAQAVERVFNNSKDFDFLKQMLPKLKRYYHWLKMNRDFDNDNLLTIISPFESGMDWKPTFDKVLGLAPQKADIRLFFKVVKVDFLNYLRNYKLKSIYKNSSFLVKEVGLNTIYARNLQSMARLCQHINDPEGKHFEELSHKVTQSILKKMFHKEDAAFYDLYGKDDVRIRVLTPTIFYPVILEGIPAEISERVVKTHFLNKDEFNTPYPIPSVAKNHTSFNPGESRYIWRGPVWVTNNWFLHQYLMEKGYHDLSQKLILSIRNLIEKSGFREYYDPFSGQGYGARDFTWSGLVIDMINMEKQEGAIK